MTISFQEYRSLDEAPRTVVLPIDRCLDSRGAPRSLDGENAEYCPPFEAREKAWMLVAAASTVAGGYCALYLAAHVIQIAGTALREVW